MKRLTATILTVLLVLAYGNAYAAEDIIKKYDLSPATELISERLTMERCAVYGKDMSFSEKDFEEVFGKSIEYIRVSELSDSDGAVLRFAGRDVSEGQIFTEKTLALLKLRPQSKDGQYVFKVESDEGLSAVCRINLLEYENNVPTANEMNVKAISGIGSHATFSSTDKDGDALTASLCDYPTGGYVTVSGNSFVYTPHEGFSGKDSFTYRVTDVYGQSSETATVNLEVRKAATSVRYVDMKNHWGQNAATRMTEVGLMTGVASDNGRSFNPDDSVTRGDFLAMAMICANLEKEITPGAVSAFSDDSSIPGNIRSYAAYAVSCGIVDGFPDTNKTSESGNRFESAGVITRAQAAKIVASLIEIPELPTELSFDDAHTIPTWAKKALTSLVSCGIMKGDTANNLSPNAPLTRAEAAQLLCNLSDYLA